MEDVLQQLPLRRVLEIGERSCRRADSLIDWDTQSPEQSQLRTEIERACSLVHGAVTGQSVGQEDADFAVRRMHALQVSLPAHTPHQGLAEAVELLLSSLASFCAYETQSAAATREEFLGETSSLAVSRDVARVLEICQAQLRLPACGNPPGQSAATALQVATALDLSQALRSQLRMMGAMDPLGPLWPQGRPDIEGIRQQRAPGSGCGWWVLAAFAAVTLLVLYGFRAHDAGSNADVAEATRDAR